MMINGALIVQKKLTDSGFRTLAAGGCVRDMLLGREPKDIDFATEAKPEQMLKVFKDFNVIPTGIKHGTLTVIVDGVPYEVTTLRTDANCDGRHADVSFCTSFEKDAKRRDFTINALFMDVETKDVFDFVEGKADIENKILRFVGDPQQRIDEDYLRILRLFRFRSVLGFSVDLKSYAAALDNLHKIKLLSAERVRDELFKMLIGDFVNTVPEQVWSSVIPELTVLMGFEQKCPRHMYDVFTHTMRGVNFLTKYKDPVLSLTHLLHDIAKPITHTTEEGRDHFYQHEKEGEALAETICTNLKMSNDEIKRVKFLIYNHLKLDKDMTIRAARRFIVKARDAGIDELDQVKIFEADYMGMRPEFLESHCYPAVKIFMEYREKISTPEYQAVSPIDGREIMDLFGVTQGKQIGQIKDYLRDLVIVGDLEQNDKETAKELAGKFIQGGIPDESTSD